MPYIKLEDKLRLSPFIDNLISEQLNEGELNYVITVLVQTFAKQRGGNYAAYNAAVGVLESSKLEFYRRCVAPYEDMKIKENGDV